MTKKEGETYSPLLRPGSPARAQNIRAKISLIIRSKLAGRDDHASVAINAGRLLVATNFTRCYEVPAYGRSHRRTPSHLGFLPPTHHPKSKSMHIRLRSPQDLAVGQ